MKASSPKATPDTLSDDVLIDLALNGNQGAYSVIVERHERMLRAVISRYFKLEEDIEECLQDTYVRMYRALPGFRRECKLSSWLCRIAISTALNRLKSKNSRRAGFSRLAAINPLTGSTEQPAASHYPPPGAFL